MVANYLYNNVRMDAGGIGFVLDDIKHFRHSPNIHHQTQIDCKVKKARRYDGHFHSDNARYSASGVCINGARILIAPLAILTQVQFFRGKFRGKSHGT